AGRPRPQPAATRDPTGRSVSRWPRPAVGAAPSGPAWRTCGPRSPAGRTRPPTPPRAPTASRSPCRAARWPPRAPTGSPTRPPRSPGAWTTSPAATAPRAAPGATRRPTTGTERSGRAILSPMTDTPGALLGPAEIRELAGRLGVRPTKTLGQNFVHDGGTVRKIVRAAGVRSGDRVVEIGPGLGSLTLGLLEAGASVVAVEIDPVLAGQVAETVERHLPGADLEVVTADAMDVPELPGEPPSALVANLPYNVAVPVLRTFLERFDPLRSVLVMVQAEV